MEGNNRQGRVFFFAIFTLLAILTFLVIQPFLGAILLALITVVLLRPLYVWLGKRKRLRDRTRLTTTVTILTFLLAIIIPLVVISIIFFGEVADFLEEVASLEIETSMTDLVQAVEDALQEVPALSDIELDEEEFVEFLQGVARGVLNWLSDLAISLGTSLPALFIGGIIFLVVLATLLPTFDELGERVQELSPLDMNVSALYLHRANVMVVSVVKGVFLLAILQGLIMGVFYRLANVPFAMFWTLLSMAFAILPVVGISFIVLPMALLALLTGNPASAFWILLGFYVFVNPLDIILRPRLVSKEAYLNFTLMLLALFGGIQLAGLLGMIYGPVIMILFLTSLDIYTQYYSSRDETPAAVETVEAETTPPELDQPEE
ncbi:MAG TPA: AI-2E family transporter [Anaerolineae bacterium]|jgi:predicted PurR-regulated permease PerM|nr:AI-2E family transporter [Anaerolineae bacterium]